jgi:hypothetical protein
MAFELTVVGRVRQCPRCELRFPDEWELEDHLASDHDLAKISHVSLTDVESPIPH